MRKSTLCLTLGLACYAGSVLAQDTSQQRGPLADLDSDGDGSISFAEFQALDGRRFTNADSNGDGALSLDEFLAAGPRPAGRLEQRLEEREIDAERIAEIEARMKQRATQDFTEMDSNGDQQISLLEMQEANFLRLDRDNNGVLEDREIRRMGRGPHPERGERRAEREGPRGEHAPNGGRRPPRQGQSDGIQ